MKHYQWKDLFEKKIESPFIPKEQDNFDVKYCTTPDRIGISTIEKYERILKEESHTSRFKGYFYYFNMADPEDQFNSIEHKFQNPHLFLENNTFQSQEEVVSNEKTIELNKFRYSKLSNSGSASSIVKNNRIGSFTSTLSNSPCTILRKNSSGSSIK